LFRALWPPAGGPRTGETLATSLRRVFGDGVEFTPAPGGMALWVRLRLPGQSLPFARLSFAWLNERELPEAVKRMAAACYPRHPNAKAIAEQI